MTKYNYRHRIDADDILNVLVVGFFILVGLAIVGGAIAWPILTYNWVHTTQTQTCHVKNKESVATSDSGHTYRVYTQECGVLDVHDEMWLGKFNSADTYNSIDPGKAYVLGTVGWRNGFFSQMPNIISATVVR